MDVKVKDENAVELTDGAKAIGFVRSTEGATVVVISADGSIRELNPGDPIFEGDILQVTDGSSIALAFADGSVRQLSSGEAFQLSQGNFDQLTLLEGFDETENPEFQDLLAALSAGEDISEDQEATAAGESGAGGGELGGGLLFSLIGSEVTPTAGIDPDYIPPPLLDPTADTDVNQEVSRRVDLGASGLVTVNADAIPENEEIVYTVQVDEAPVGSDLILTLTNGVQITILEGQNSGTSSPQPAQGDDVYKDGETFNVGIQSSSGGGYDTLNISDTTSVTIVDTIDASVVTITVVDAAGDVIADPSTIVEGTTAFFRYSVDNPPETDLTLTTTDLGNVIITAAGPGYTDVAVPNRADDRYDQGPDETTADVLTWSGGNYEDLTHTSTADATIVDDNDASVVTITVVDAAGDVIADPSTIVEGTTAFFRYSVDNPPETDLTLTTTDLGNVIITAAGPGYTDVAVPNRADDRYDQGPDETTADVLTWSGGNYEDLTHTSTADATIVDDNDASVVTITVVDAAGDVIADPSTIVEGTTAFFRYSVDNAPETDLTLTTTDLGNVIITAAGPGYTDVAVPNRADDRYDQGPDETTADVLTWSGGNYEDLTHTSTADATIVDDNDASTVTLTATASVDVGGLITYTATVVNTPVSTPLVITIQDENNVTLGNITINPGEFEGTLEVAAPGEADVSYDVTILSATGGTYEALDITDGASTVVSGIPASSAMITNTNVGIQEVRITVASNEGSNSTGVVDPTEVQGQEGSRLKFDDDVFFKPGNYTVTIEHVTGDPVILTDLSITDSNANELLIYEGNAKLETGDTRGNTNPDGYIFNVVIGPDFGSDATDFTVSEPIGFEVLGGILTLDTASSTDDFTLDFSELSINGGQDLFGYVDTIDISGKGTGEDNTIFLSAQDVIDLGTGGDIEINIIGDDADDVVNLVDGDAYADTVWQKVGSTDQYDFVDTGNGDFVLATVLADGNVVVNIT